MDVRIWQDVIMGDGSLASEPWARHRNRCVWPQNRCAAPVMVAGVLRLEGARRPSALRASGGGCSEDRCGMIPRGKVNRLHYDVKQYFRAYFKELRKQIAAHDHKFEKVPHWFKGGRKV